MFGYPAAFVGGHFFVGLHEDQVVMRLPESLRTMPPELVDAAALDPMRNGKGLKDWLVIPSALVNQPKRLAALLTAALPQRCRRRNGNQAERRSAR